MNFEKKGDRLVSFQKIRDTFYKVGQLVTTMSGLFVVLAANYVDKWTIRFLEILENFA